MFLFCSFKGKSQPGWQKARKTGVFDGRAADATHARECDEPVSADSRHQPQMCRLGEVEGFEKPKSISAGAAPSRL
jgi:hypothetical protein